MTAHARRFFAGAMLAAAFFALFLAAVPLPAAAQSYVTDEKIDLWGGYWGDPDTGLISCRPQGIIQRNNGIPVQDPTTNLPVVIPGTACNICHMFLTTKRLIYFGLSVLLYILAPTMITWGGFLIMTAGGSQEKVSKAIKVFTGTAWGLAFGLGGFIIVNFFFSVFTPTVLTMKKVGEKVVEGKVKLNWWKIDCNALPDFGQYQFDPNKTPVPQDAAEGEPAEGEPAEVECGSLSSAGISLFGTCPGTRRCVRGTLSGKYQCSQPCDLYCGQGEACFIDMSGNPYCRPGNSVLCNPDRSCPDNGICVYTGHVYICR